MISCWDFVRKKVKDFASVDKYLETFFQWYGYQVYKYKWIFLIFPVVFTMLASTGFIFMKSLTVNSTEYIFTPYDGQSAYEKAAMSQKFPLNSDAYIPGKFFQLRNWIDVVVKAKDSGNILRSNYLNDIDGLNDFIMNKFTIHTEDNRFNLLTYRDLCLSWEGKCYDNAHIKLLIDKEEIDKYVQLTYPITRKYDVPVYLASVLGGVVVSDDVGHFNVVTSIRLSYHLVQDPYELNVYSLQWRKEFQNYILSSFHSESLEVGIYHADSVGDGLAEISNKFLPNFVITFAILSIFTVFCSLVTMTDPFSLSVDWVRSKPILAVIGIISACMAIATAYGLCLLLQQEYNPVISTMPFLALAIGVNDMFIMTNAWHRTKLGDPVGKRMSQVMREAAVAISITSFTDVISFAIGTWNSLPAVIMFCKFTSVALMIDYIYQITFFSAAISIFGEIETSGRHCVLLLKLKRTTAVATEKGFWKKNFFSGSFPKQEPCDTTKHVSVATVCSESKRCDAEKTSERSTNNDEPRINRFFRCHYGPCLMHPSIKCTVVGIFCIYIAVAIYGCYTIKEGLQPDKLVLRTHYLKKYVDMMRSFWAEGMLVHILVNNAPDLTLAVERDKLFEMVQRFENTEHTMSSNATVFFLKEFLGYLKYYNIKLDNSSELWVDELHSWIETTGGRSMWLTDVVWDQDSRILTSFRFQVGLKNFERPVDHMHTMNELRSIASEYPDYNITTYHEYWPYADQYQMIKPIMLRDNVTAIVTMIVLALILIPNVLCGIFITVAMITINIGVYGYMSLWNINLDSVSMITLIMAIGFAIDLSSHICYAYISTKGTTTERTVSALERLGWPVLQGALATVLGVTVLATVDSYVVQTFFKTVFLVITFGLMHSIVFLPVALSLFLKESR